MASGCNENEVLVGMLILASRCCQVFFQTKAFFPTLRSKLVFHEKFVKKKLYCFVNQRGQLISRLKTKNRLFTGRPHFVRFQMREVCQTIAYHFLVKIKERYVSVNVDHNTSEIILQIFQLIMTVIHQ